MTVTNLILLIEDSEDDALVTRLALEKAGFHGQMLHIADPRRAVRYLLGEAEFGDRVAHPLPQAILLDLKMPEMDGFEFLAWLRTQPQLSRIMVVALTRLEELQHIKMAYSLGAHSFLTKGADPVELQNVVKFLNDYARLSAFPPSAPGADGKEKRL